MTQRQRYQPAPPTPADALDVMGVGLTVEQTSAPALWPLVQADGAAKVPSSTPAGSLAACRDRAESLRAATLRGAFQHRLAQGGASRSFVENYPVPASLALPSRHRDMADVSAWGDHRIDLLRNSLRSGAGMPFHNIDPRSMVQLTTDNDWLLTRAFERFDRAGDLNSFLLWAEDGYAIRSELGGWENPQKEALGAILSRSKRTNDLSDTFAAVLLGRPAAMAWLQELAPHVRDSGRATAYGNGATSRTMHGYGGLGIEHRTNHATYQSPQNYTATSYVPAPWSQAQVRQYDEMPTLAFLHRPETVVYADYGDAPNTASSAVPMAQRADRLQAALKEVITKAFKGQPPQRVFYDAGPLGDEGNKPALLVRSLHAVLPGISFTGNSRWIGLSQRLGNTGAAAAYASVALASLASWETAESALVVHMRRDDGATVFAITPVPETYRKRFSHHPYESV